MIDLDQLDAQLERALTDDVRAMRNSPPRPRFDHSRPGTLTMVPAGPRTLAEKLASIGDDLDTYPPPLYVEDEDEDDEVDEVEVEEVEAVTGPTYDGELEAVLDDDEEDEDDLDAGFEADFEFEYDLVTPEPEPAPAPPRPRPARPAPPPRTGPSRPGR